MDRRRFLEAGTASAASLLAASACAPAMKLAEQRPTEAPADMEAYLARIDAGMARLGRFSSANHPPFMTYHTPESDALAQATLQSLFLTGMVGDLPVPAQLHQGVQDRVERAMPTFDAATDGMMAFLRSRDAEELALVQSVLRDHAAGPRIIDALDEEAASLGLSSWRRDQTRTIYANAEWRLRNQPPSLLISEYVEKVERLTAADVEAEASAQVLAARAAEDAFWRASGDLRSRRIRRGAKALGYGLLIFAGGGAVVAAGAWPGVFVMTAGVVTMLIGLVILLVGVLTRSDPKARTDTAIVRPR